MNRIWDAVMEFDLNNITHEWAFVAIMCFILSVVFAICWVTKYKESAEKSDEINNLNMTIDELNKIIDGQRSRETEILENFGRNLTKLNDLERENGRYKDADEYSKIFLDKAVLPVVVKETVNMTEGTYAYFVDEEKKREFALHSTKKAILKEIVDILANKDYVQWKNVYDARNLSYTVTGNILILTDKE